MSKKLYLSMWRWHFFAGLFVIPFLFILSLSGIGMLLSEPLREWQHSDLFFVDPAREKHSLEEQKTVVAEAYGGYVSLYIPAKTDDRSNQFKVKQEDGNTLLAFVNPYTAMLLGHLSEESSLYSFTNELHGELFLGDYGDLVIEAAASLTILLVASGLYLWWPRNGTPFWRVFTVRLNASRRLFWRDLHAAIGVYLSMFIVFFMMTGLSWTNIWGGQIVQPWSSFPSEKWADVPLSDETHQSLNHGVHEEVAWGLEQTPLPESRSHEAHQVEPEPIDLDHVSNVAESLGFQRYRVNIPRDENGVYTVSADTMSKDVDDPRDDRTVHIDQYSGEVLADVRFADYSPMAKGMAAGVALHQGDVGSLNFYANLGFCLLMMTLCVSAILAWWLRRPGRSLKLEAPPQPDLPLWQTATLLVCGLALLFPVAAAMIAGIVIMEWLILSRLKPLRSWYR